MTLDLDPKGGQTLLTRLGGTRQGRWTILALAALLGCQPPQRAPEPAPPAPVGIGADGAIDRAKVLAAGRAQHYDENPGSSLKAILDEGVAATIEPDAGAYRIPAAVLDQGVVVGRFRNQSDTPLKRLGLIAGGTTYWFIYRKDKQLMSAYIADTESGEYDVIDVPTMMHRPTRPWRQSVAQWQLPGVIGDKPGATAMRLSGGQQPWLTCADWGCCKPES
ncbi:MAG: hypothetical protein ABI742_14570 [Gemmatimonadota bacterium]